MKLRKFSTALVAAVALATVGLASPASAASTTFTLPKVCQPSMGKSATSSELKSWGVTIKSADLLPTKGTEFAYVLNCVPSGAADSRAVVVIASSTGKALSAKVLPEGAWGFVTSASSSKGVKVTSYEEYKGFVNFERRYTAKWSTKYDKVVVTRHAAPGYVKATYNLAVQMNTGKKITAVKGSSTSLSALTKFGKKYKANKDHFSYCENLGSGKGQCGLLYYKSDRAYFAVFNMVKSGTAYKATSVKVGSEPLSGD